MFGAVIVLGAWHFRRLMTPPATRVIYPVLPDPLVPGDLQNLFSPSFDERKWAPTIARTLISPVAQMIRVNRKELAIPVHAHGDRIAIICWQPDVFTGSLARGSYWKLKYVYENGSSPRIAKVVSKFSVRIGCIFTTSWRLR